MKNDITLTFLGNLTGAFLGFLALVIITNNLSISDFGLFSTSIAFILTISHLSTLGFDQTMVKQSSTLLGEEKEIEAAQVIRIALLARFIAGASFAYIVFLFSGYLAKEMLNDSSKRYIFELSAYAVVSYSMFEYFKYVCFSYKAFKKAIFIQIAVDALKLSSVVYITLFFEINLYHIIFIYSLAPVLGITIGIYLFANKLLRYPILEQRSKHFISLFLSFSKWTFLSSSCKVIIPNVSIFMLTKMVGSKASGLYGLGLNLTYIFPILIASVSSVLLPSVSRFREYRQIKQYLISCLKTPLYLSVLVIILVFISPYFIKLLFGEKYAEAIPVFNWLLAGFTLSAVNNAFYVAFYALDKPRIVALIYIYQLTFIIAGNYYLIPVLDVLAPAFLFFAVNLTSMIFIIFYVFCAELRKSGQVVSIH